MINTETEINYNNEFIGCLLKEVDDKISLISNKDYKTQIYNLGKSKNPASYSDLLFCHDILEKVLKCDSCFKQNDICIEDVVSVVKNKLQSC